MWAVVAIARWSQRPTISASFGAAWDNHVKSRRRRELLAWQRQQRSLDERAWHASAKARQQRLATHSQAGSLPASSRDQICDVQNRLLNQAARSRWRVAALAVHHYRFEGPDPQHFGDAVERLVQGARDVGLGPFRLAANVTIWIGTGFHRLALQFAAVI